uniref:Integrator complex subunit 2 n=1 Tax=Plectus sambesii TaxID=2011161 RepID=A0A914W1R1_9BILA
MPLVSQEVFEALRNGTLIHRLHELSDEDLRPILPTLVRASVLPGNLPIDDQDALRCRLMAYPEANSLIQLLSVDFEQLDTDLKVQKALRKKALDQGSATDDVGLADSKMERAEAMEKHAIVSGHLLCVALLNDRKLNVARKFEPFDNPYLLEEAAWLLCIGVSELPKLLNVAKMAETLLSFANGPEMIVQLIANFPDKLTSVTSALLAADATGDEDLFVTRQRVSTLLLLHKLDPRLIEPTLCTLLSSGQLPALVIGLMAQLDDVDFCAHLLRALTDGAGELCAYLTACGKKGATNASGLCVIRQRVSLIVERIVSGRDESDTISMGDVDLAVDVLRLIAALKCFASLRLTPDEAVLWMALVTVRAAVSPSGTQFLTTSLCTLLACPLLLHAQMGEAEQKAEGQLISWLTWLLESEQQFSQSGCSYSELLLLVAIQFHSNQITQMGHLVSSVLGFKVSLPAKMLTRIRNLFTYDLINEQQITQRAAGVAVTSNLSAHTLGYLPVHCVTQLLSTRSFAKHGVAIKDWIMAQVLQSTTPVHSAMPELIEAFARSCVSTSAKSNANTPLDEAKLRELFAGDPLEESLAVPRVLALLFLLSFEYYGDVDAKKAAAADRRFEYSAALWSRIPVRFLLDLVERRKTDFQAVRSNLTKLAANQCPYLLPTVEAVSSSVHSSTAADINISPESLAKALYQSTTSPSHAIRLLHQLQRAPVRRQVAVASAIVQGMAQTLNPEAPRAVITALAGVWKRVETCIPRTLYEMTARALCPTWSTVTDEELMEDPLIVFRCDERVLRSADHLECVLRMLTFYLSASRARLQRRLATAPIGPDPMQTLPPQAVENEREELMRAVIGAQESAVVQLLLDMCRTRHGDDESGLSRLREVRGLVCAQVHQMFIADPVLSKLVHFQTYDLQLIKVTVAGIPSMHICMDFVPELLGQSDVNKRVFAVALMAELCEQYAVVGAFSRARLTIDVLSTLLSTLPIDVSLDMFSVVVPSLAKFSRVFPPLAADVASLLVQVGAAAKARLAFRSGSSKQSSERKLIEMIASLFRTSMKESALAFSV